MKILRGVVEVFFIVCLYACTPAQSVAWQQIENVILQDLTSHQTLETIETAVALLVPDGTDVDLAITTAIDYLHAIGVLPPNILDTALGMQSVIASKVHLIKESAK